MRTNDFPVAWADDHYVTRREFTKSLALVSCAAFGANGVLTAWNRSRQDPNVKPVKVAQIGELPVGGAKLFDFPEPGEACLLLRLSADRFVAFSQKCTHLGCPVLFRPETKTLRCPCHEGRFDAENGGVISGPPLRPLPRVELERKGDELWAVAIRR